MSLQRQEMEISGTAPVEQTTREPVVLKEDDDPNKPFRNRSQRARWDYGGHPLARDPTNASQQVSVNEAFFRPGAYVPQKKKQANPAPLCLSGFALTTFLLSLINLGVRGVSTPNIVVGPALAYGGIIQLLGGMWEIALGNTFGGWAFASYGGFWIGVAIALIPGLFEIEEAYNTPGDFYTVFGFFIFGWFIFTFFVLLAVLRSTLILFLLVGTVDLAFLCLGIGYLRNSGGMEAAPSIPWQRAGGGFGIIAGFLAWWVMFEGLLEKPNNSFFEIPVFTFPWAEQTLKKKGLETVQTAGEGARDKRLTTVKSTSDSDTSS